MKKIKLVSLCVVCILSFVSMLTPERGQSAVVGGIADIAGGAGTPALISGIVLAGMGGALCGYSYTLISDGPDNPGVGVGIIGTFIGVGVFAVGVTLDETPSSMPRFQVPSKEQAIRLGWTDYERAQFSAEIDELNSIAEAVYSTLTLDRVAKVEDSAKMWKENLKLLSLDTVSALGKLVLTVQSTGN